MDKSQWDDVNVKFLRDCQIYEWHMCSKGCCWDDILVDKFKGEEGTFEKCDLSPAKEGIDYEII